jgi:hypothetical protein
MLAMKASSNSGGSMYGPTAARVADLNSSISGEISQVQIDESKRKVPHHPYHSEGQP